jgi:hypothetical protein
MFCTRKEIQSMNDEASNEARHGHARVCFAATTTQRDILLAILSTSRLVGDARKTLGRRG